MSALAGMPSDAGAKLNSQAILLADEPRAELRKLEQTWAEAGNVRRLWRKDSTLWTGGEEGKWLDWLGIVDAELERIGELEAFAAEVREGNFRDVLLLGMGGSSLGPEVLANGLGSAAGFPRVHVLDSTDPQQIRTLEALVDLERTLFIVSSKSGTTLEPNIFFEYFWARAAAALGTREPGDRFIAVTDPGSHLQKVAEQKNFRRIFPGVPGIGGRYSVLSNFGMVPLAASGRSVRVFLEHARDMARACGAEAAPAQNPGVQLGLALGLLARHGRDKVTIIASASLGGFGAWAEQLLAESTGKNGTGLIPVDLEPLGEPAVYGLDRVFIYLEDTRRPDAAQARAIETLEGSGQPIVRIGVPGPELLGQEFFRWEIATAVAGAVIGIDPFDQPDVEASKVATRELTDAYERQGSVPAERAVFSENGIALFTDEDNARALKAGGAGNSLESWLAAHLARLDQGDYFALLAYLERNLQHTEASQRLRIAVRDRRRVATCLGFGPRFLHSTGQAYKGGPNSGVFLQVTCKDALDLEIPGRKATFGVVKDAQARGDFRVLAERRRRVLRAHLAEDVSAGLAALDRAAERALS